ncbi:hypothetical protein [Alkalihalobacterium alkalinitrilicum]|uniref:hypothetical protein n=1 Tax=Alkalihalobacterium alkalinitrilicum TaxID=427920 RepID=UPI0009959E29|nr:hypothetical protein [Alkalihalobacterium alkalinitrilicum]
MDSFTYFILGLLVLVSAVIIAVYCINKKKSFVLAIVLIAVGFILAFIGLFNSEHEESQNAVSSIEDVKHDW